MKLTLNIPETLKEITLNQYQQWLKIAEDKEPSLFLQQKMIEIFCGITLNQVMQIKALDVDTITEDIAKVFKEKTRLINRFTLNEIEFGFIPKLDDMSFGEYVDLDNYMSDWQQMHKAMSVLFRPITFKKKNQYLIEDYETAEKHNIKEMTLDIVFGSMVFFWNLRTELQNHILNYLANQEEVPLPPETKASLLNGVGTAVFTPWHQTTF
tara:strand:+ start:201 stop:830 length:630 start_codon:yes stop_codon:yes gene_type:complete